MVSERRIIPPNNVFQNVTGLATGILHDANGGNNRPGERAARALANTSNKANHN